MDEQVLDKAALIRATCEAALFPIMATAAASGRDLKSEAVNWAQRYLNEMAGDTARLELEKLRRAGCKLFPLAVTMRVSAWISALPQLAEEIVPAERCRFLAGEFERTALLLESLERDFGADVAAHGLRTHNNCSLHPPSHNS